MEERMTLCNMAIEGGARCGYVNPDQVTFDYLKGRPHAPEGEAWNRAVAWWSSLATDANATVDDEVVFDAAAIPPTVTWGITPGQGLGIDETVPSLDQLDPGERPIAEEEIKVRTSVTRPFTAAAATIAGLINRVRPLAEPCRPLKLRLLELALI